MLGLKILAGVAVLFVLFCRTRLGVLVELGDNASADVTFGFLRFRVAPAKGGAKKPKEKKPKKEKPKKEPRDLTKALKKFPKPTAEDLKSAYRLLQPAMKKMLRRFGRGIRIHPLSLSVTLSGRDDPAQAAETYGYVCAAIWTVMPPLEELIDIPRPSLHAGVDYDAQNILVRGQVGVSLRVGTLLAMGLGIMIPGVRWVIKFYMAHKNDSPRTDKKAETQAPTAAA